MGLKVIDSGFWTTVQDAGRTGYREWGVPAGGPFDRGSADLANAMVGNPPGCAVLEFTLHGGVFEALGSLGIGLAGAPLEASIKAADGRTRPLRVPSSGTLDAGESLVLGRTEGGARTYLAVKDGFQTCPKLGSRSCEQPLRRGDFLPASTSFCPARHPGQTFWQNPVAHPLRIIDGPEIAALVDSDSLCQGIFRVGSQSDRRGLRLEGPPVIVVASPDRLSAPVTPGALQVAGSQLIILGVASGTMGGYPHVAHVISVDLDRLGQLCPGNHVQLERITLQQARALDRDARQAHRARSIRLASLARDLSFNEF
jgi:antagonist of KipI